MRDTGMLNYIGCYEMNDDGFGFTMGGGPR